MGRKYEDETDTMQLIKDAIYDLQIGPTEISPSTKPPVTYTVKFENCNGGAEEVIVPVPSLYTSICYALKLAFNDTARKNN
jgi:hypothetical protein